MTHDDPQSPLADRSKHRTGLSARVLGEGTDPDPRFTLANERTFLAWVRTSLAFLAGGIALEAFAGEVFPLPLRTAVSVVLLMLGMLVAAGATWRWMRIERAMRQDLPLPLPWIAPVLAVGAALAAGLMIGMLVLP